MLVAVPLVAFGGADSGPNPTPSPALERALDVRDAVEDVNAEALEEAPPAVGSTCRRGTIDVEGIGDACATDDGMLRVVQEDGRSATVHGLDAPPTSAGAFPPAAQTAVNGASAADITCVGAGEARYTLVYAHPGNATNRYGTVAPRLRTEAYKVSAFIDSESRSVDPDAGRRLPMRCDGGTEPIVLQATLSGLDANGADFNQIVDALRAQGYDFNGDGSGLERYVVYFDAPSPSGAAGTGHIFAGDARASADNANNRGGLYAVEYRYAGGGGVPHWEVLIHEVIHTMGAVVETAPGSNGAGHCNDGQDIMCYDDGSPGSNYTSSQCGTKVLDCNRDSYFNPSPAAGSFLAGSWNAAATYNRWLRARQAGDRSAPTTPGGLVQTGTSQSAIGIAWDPSTDDVGVTGYVVSIHEPGAAWRTVTTTSRRTASIGGLAGSTAYEVRVVAQDKAGNASGEALLAAATNDQPDRTAPSAPASVSARVTSGRVVFSWRESGDDVGVASYELRRLTPTKSDPRTRVPRSAGRTAETTISISAKPLKPGAAYQYEVVAIDHAGNLSRGTRRVVRIAKDTRRPTTPTRVRATGRTTSTVTLAWSPSRDNVRVARYFVYQRVGRRWVQLRTPVLSASTRALRVTRLRPHATYSFRVVARDTAGNRSRASRAVTVRTR